MTNHAHGSERTIPMKDENQNNTPPEADFPNDPLDNSLISRLKKSARRAARKPVEVKSRIETPEVLMRDSVRDLARSRLSLALRQLRAAHGLSYADIQERTGLSQQLLWDVEYKESRLTFDELELLVECYGLSAGDILGVEFEVSNRLAFERIRQKTRFGKT